MLKAVDDSDDDASALCNVLHWFWPLESISTSSKSLVEAAESPELVVSPTMRYLPLDCKYIALP